jgi:hypothetical protein
MFDSLESLPIGGRHKNIAFRAGYGEQIRSLENIGCFFQPAAPGNERNMKLSTIASLWNFILRIFRPFI